MKIDKSLSIYRNKSVILWGASSEGEMAYDILERNGISVIAFFDTAEEKWGKCFLGLEILSLKKMKRRLKSKNTVLQIASCNEIEIMEQLKNMGITNYVSYSELLLIPELEKFLMFEKKPQLYDYFLKYIFCPVKIFNHMWNYSSIYTNQKYVSSVICCMPTKTGNHTVMHTGKKYCPPDVLLVDSWHTSFHVNEFFDVVNTLKKKIVTAVREPISQNLSLLYELAGSGLLVDQTAFWENDYDELLKKIYEIECNKNNKDCMYRKDMHTNHMTELVQNFFENEFEQNLGIRLYDYPFDKEKGCSIIQVGDLEIFIFQVEKLNVIYKELFQFIGLNLDLPLENGNVAENKWYRDYYKKAKETITFSKEYFEWSYNSPYLRHFYSKKDIEEFKQKWITHIR